MSVDSKVDKIKTKCNSRKTWVGLKNIRADKLSQVKHDNHQDSVK